jgi:hypothetical protein
MREDDAMRTTRFAPWISALLSATCLMIGFGLARYWEIVYIIPVIIVYWYFARKTSLEVVLSILLVAYIFLAVLGLLIRLSPYLMMIGCYLALISWESALFFAEVGGGSGLFHQKSQPLETLHLKDLIIVTSIGLLLGLMGLNFHLHLPFGVVAILALMAIYGFYRGLRFLMK